MVRDDNVDFIFKQLQQFVEGAYAHSDLDEESLNDRRVHQTNLALTIRETMDQFEPTEQEVRFAIATVTMCYLAAIADASICTEADNKSELERVRHKVEHMAACIQDYVMALAQFPEVEVSV